MEKEKTRQTIFTKEFEIFVKDITPSEIYNRSTTRKGQDITYNILGDDYNHRHEFAIYMDEFDRIKELFPGLKNSSIYSMLVAKEIMSHTGMYKPSNDCIFDAFEINQKLRNYSTSSNNGRWRVDSCNIRIIPLIIPLIFQLKTVTGFIL